MRAEPTVHGPSGQWTDYAESNQWTSRPRAPGAHSRRELMAVRTGIRLGRLESYTATPPGCTCCGACGLQPRGPCWPGSAYVCTFNPSQPCSSDVSLLTPVGSQAINQPWALVGLKGVAVQYLVDCGRPSAAPAPPKPTPPALLRSPPPKASPPHAAPPSLLCHCKSGNTYPATSSWPTRWSEHPVHRSLIMLHHLNLVPLIQTAPRHLGPNPIC
jgi:hypothetical protein